MDRCRHVSRVRPAADHSILNPQKWLCSFCGTTESVWACLSCSNVACGRYNEEHALKHYEQTKHPLAIEVNDKYVYCYICDEYILNDNAAGDIKILRSALSAIATHTFSDYESRGKRVLRSLSYPGYEKKWQDEQKLQNQDRQFTALKFRRYYMLARMFNTWRKKTKVLPLPKPLPRVRTMPAKVPTPKTTTTPSRAPSKKTLTPSMRKHTIPLAATLRKRPVIPGVTGLRNLGNTCYMNSVLQVLRSFLANFSHLHEFKEYFLALKNTEEKESQTVAEVTPSATDSPPRASTSTTPSPERRETRQSQQMLLRQSTIECFQHISAGQPGVRKGGLNGGSTMQSPPHRKQINGKSSQQIATENSTYTLCEELHALFRVMWSGKWAVVSPHKMLYAVWNIIPFFKGYTQQDAQEFLCEFIDKVQLEMTHGVPGAPSSLPQTTLINASTNFISNLFQGKLVSEVRCRRCSHQSQTFEPFMDLSLEFPRNYQATGAAGANKKSCHLEAMLRGFTETEKLDGQVYACDECNKRRRSVAARPTVRTEAEKQLLIQRLPPVLRLHLKRFMWGGRNNRGKITSHVQFEEELDMAPYCHSDVDALSFHYELSAVVIHHGRGFGSGHYTTFCYHREADSWVHCNDARVQLSNIEEVLKAQAYILFYTQKRITRNTITDASTSSEDGATNSPCQEKADEDIVFKFPNSNMPEFLELKRRLSDDGTGAPSQPALKRARSNIW